jgi:hypothetical protein
LRRPLVVSGRLEGFLPGAEPQIAFDPYHHLIALRLRVSNDATNPGAGLMADEPPRKQRGIIFSRTLYVIGWLVAFAFGRLTGMMFIIPFVITLLALFALKRLTPNAPSISSALIAVQIGHWGWMATALFLPKGFSQVAFDLVVLGMLLIWFCTTRSAVAALTMLAFQAISLCMNVYAATSASGSQLVALSVHVLFRFVAIALIATFLFQTRRGRGSEANAPTGADGISA